MRAACPGKWQVSGFLFIFAVFIAVLACGSHEVSASEQDITWVTVEGTSPLVDVSEEEAKSRAVEDARRKAVEEAVGAHISAEDLVVNFRLSGGIVSAIPYGRVVDETILEEKAVTTLAEGKDRPTKMYRVVMKAGVVEETEGADPSFRLESSLNRSSFKDGEEMFITIRSTEDCYLAVFTIMEDEKILRLIPSRHEQDNFLKANETFSFPDEKDRRRGVKLKVHVPENKDAVTEAIYILALKGKATFDASAFREGIYGTYDGKAPFMKDLIQGIVGIPLSGRAEKLLQYHIKKKSGGVQ